MKTPKTSRLNTRISKHTISKINRGIDTINKGLSKGGSDTGDKVPKRANLVMKRLEEQLVEEGVEDPPTVTVEKNMIISGDVKEEVYMYRFGDSFISPIDGTIKFITKTIGRQEKEHVLTCRVTKSMAPYEDLSFVRSFRIPTLDEMIIVSGWQKKELETLFTQRETYMRNIKYPNAHKIMVPTYALSESTRRYLRHEYLKTNLDGVFTVIGGK